jgi:tRNA A37 methylthiotransferase MiaB
MQKCLIISFDFPKSDYPTTSYAIACILAKFSKKDLVDMEHYQYQLNQYIYDTPKKEIEQKISTDFKEKYLSKINDYSFVALSAYAWTENLVNKIIEIIRAVFNGKIILGGYEITALSKEKLFKVYPNVDYYIKGYAEKSLEMIFTNETTNKVIDLQPNIDDFVSPYLSGVLLLNTKKVHWESKRGCKFKCDFCEWGKAVNDIVRISECRIDKEIKLFKQNKIQEINLLDATFLLKKEDITTLKKLLSIPNCKICLQMHFSTIKNEVGDEFLDICEKHKDRISLEFGLQTIHKIEMEVLKRKNNVEQVESVMQKLQEKGIDYEVSIIFGIPGQTIKSFVETIEFIKKNGCEKFKAFPLRLPQNSEMMKNRNEWGIKEIEDKHFSLKYVNESNSFNNSDWEIMFGIAEDCARVPLSGDPFVAMLPVIDKITRYYVNGGLRGRFWKR